MLISSDVCTTANCGSLGSSYNSSNNGTGLDTYNDGDDSGAINKGTNSPYDTFSTYGVICTSTSATDCSKEYSSVLGGNTGSLSVNRLTQEIINGSSSYYLFFDTFTAGANGFSGDVVFYGNLAWMQAGDTTNSGCASPSSSLVVECDDKSGANRPAVGFVAGNDAWASTYITYQLDGDSPTFIYNFTGANSLGAGQSVSVAQFVLLEGSGGGPYTPNPSGALSEAAAIQGDPNLGGLNAKNFDPTPEPATFGLVGAGLALGFSALRRRRA